MPVAVAALGITIFCLALRLTVIVARTRDLPAWRRYLPLALLLIAGAASLLRAFGIPQIAEAVSFPFNLAAVVLALREVRARRGMRAGLRAD
ncbi:hypothetical protein Stsp02_58340 [Streptomyces sp. NBRC 14336]|uniref:hypothetical protein n=1 Tax=Streptomyces sp. NBRC 14336 TaxID=3030992 RepID=UPI0024A56ED2|nr:hypothetical protein [Streptomyces sp. NBRC 14336]WBO78531.1 hypothetical protein SBE_002146 [Streptomyces sp. SBE_14.2]GLW50173.1 hypothetical protein Stsp02_58340 [Streptomyces sp. NBRC 14336]